jgi:hypothetical protein
MQSRQKDGMKIAANNPNVLPTTIQNRTSYWSQLQHDGDKHLQNGAKAFRTDTDDLPPITGYACRQARANTDCAM